MNPLPKRDRDRYGREITKKLQLGSELFSKTLTLHGVNGVRTNQRRHFWIAWVKAYAYICLDFANSSVTSLTKLDRDARSFGHVIWQQLAYRQITLGAANAGGSRAHPTLCSAVCAGAYDTN